jgi:hypothetical protein
MSGEDFCWRIPVTAPNLAAPIVLAVTIGTTSMYRTEHFLVKTVLPSDVYARSSELQELDSYLTRRNQSEMFSQESITTTMRLINNLREEN